LFDKKVSFTLEDLKKLNNPQVRVRLIEVFVDRINDLTAESEDIAITDDELKASDITPFPWTGEVYEARKTVLNLTPVSNKLEEKFARIIDNDDEVAAFIRNDDRTLGFRITYIDQDGFVKNYVPDFVLRTIDDTFWVVETKGQEDVVVKLKDKRAEQWTKEVSKLTGKDWKYKRVDQKTLEMGRFSSFNDIVLS
ncbi:MAG: hypothetical protein V1778_00030, partial [bacterium]